MISVEKGLVSSAGRVFVSTRKNVKILTTTPMRVIFGNQRLYFFDTDSSSNTQTPGPYLTPSLKVHHGYLYACQHCTPLPKVTTTTVPKGDPPTFGVPLYNHHTLTSGPSGNEKHPFVRIPSGNESSLPETGVTGVRCT